MSYFIKRIYWYFNPPVLTHAEKNYLLFLYCGLTRVREG